MDPLEALGDHGADTEQQRAFGGPVARAAGAVLLAGDHDQRHAFGLVLHRGVEDALDFALRSRHPIRRQLEGPITLAVGHQLVAQAHIAKGAAHHHLVVAAASAVRVEVAQRDAVLDQVAARTGVFRIEPAGEMWSVVIGVAHHHQHPGVLDVGQWPWFGAEAGEEWRLLHVRRLRIPVEQITAFWQRQGRQCSSPSNTSAYS